MTSAQGAGTGGVPHAKSMDPPVAFLKAANRESFKHPLTIRFLK